MIIGHLSGDTRVLLAIQSRGIIVRDELRSAITTQGLRVLGLVKAKVSGPVLKSRTGTLRRKLNMQLTESPEELTASVGLKLSYAAVHEYGFDGTVTIREHLRHVKSGDVRGRLDGGRSRVLAQGIGRVREHTRHMHVPERSYLRSTLAEEHATIRAAMLAAVRRAFT